MSLFKKILFPIITIIAIFLIVLNTKQSEKREASNNYILKSYKNCIALYKNGELLEVYNDIVLNTLPSKDIQSFNKGIRVNSKEEINKILEDYDG